MLFKYTATGNDFLFVDLLSAQNQKSWKKLMLQKTRAEAAKQICSRHFGVGADGLVFLEPKDKLDFAWDFYNSDGSAAEMCGNAARSAGLHMYLQHKKNQIRFETKSGVIESEYKSPQNIRVKMPKISEAKWHQLAPLVTKQIHYDFILAGVPHAVVRVPSFKPRGSLKAWAKELKCLPVFGKASTNVTFVREMTEDLAHSMTFERGVEGFTLSCGTGAVAAAFSLTKGEEGSLIKLRVPGGNLSVEFKNKLPFLIGPALCVGQIDISKDFFRGENS